MGNQRPVKKRLSSVAWDYFTKHGNSQAKCQLCDKILSFQGGNTTNLTRHVITRHKLPLKVGSSLKRLIKSDGDTDQNGGVIILENFNGESFPPEIILQESDVHKTQIQKRKNKSPIWKYFTYLGGYRAKCHFCKAPISTKGGSTSNLKRHLKKKHKKVVVVVPKNEDKCREDEDNMKVEGEVIIVQRGSVEPEIVINNYIAPENTEKQTDDNISPSPPCEENPPQQNSSPTEIKVLRKNLTSNLYPNGELDNNRDQIISFNQDTLSGQQDNQTYLKDISDGRASYNPPSPLNNQHSYEFNKNTEAFMEIANNLGRLATAFERIADVLTSTKEKKTGNNERNTISILGSKLNDLITNVLEE